MVMQNISWHKAVLADTEAWLKREESYLAEAQARVSRIRDTVNRMKLRIAQAEAIGCTDFEIDGFSATFKTPRNTPKTEA
jgi:hypothetical protein